MILVYFFVFLLVHSDKIKGADSNSIALKPERVQLLKDALGWMTFRKNGVLMEELDVESLFLDTLLQKYTTSKLYRTFVIAFHQGVLPGLILQEGDSCDSDYPFQFKDPFNSSVTWHYQKEFTFKSYDDRMSSGGGQYCDYRQGLKCIPSTKKCECPEGSKMQPISPTSQVQRCLLEKDEICALIDIDHGNDPLHSALASNLYHMIFNLEKPPSCKDGTQCRFKDSNRNYPLCYENNNGPWFPNKSDVSFELGLGEECAIGLYVSQGSCKVETTDGEVERYICYNLGPQKSIRGQNPGAENRTGFCFNEWGIYGLGVRDTWSLAEDVFFRPYFIAFVHPRTVPLRGNDLKDFYDWYTYKIVGHFHDTGDIIESDNEGDKCNVEKTQKMEQAWKYFAGLEADPPPGKDYVITATITELSANLEIVEEVTGWDGREWRMCKVYWTIRDDDVELPSLTCVKSSSVDAHGNDGTCQLAGSGAYTKELAEKIYRFRRTANSIYEELRDGERNYREEILAQNLESECLPSLTPVPQRLILDTLEGGSCPKNSVCYQDFRDSSGVYDNDIDCNIKPDAEVRFVCHNIGYPLDTNKCEGRHVWNKLKQALKNLDKYEKLGRGESCLYYVEMTIRKHVNQVHEFNYYGALTWIERGICDRKLKHLECTEDGTCESMEGSIGGAIQPCVKPVAIALIIIAISGIFSIM